MSTWWSLLVTETCSKLYIIYTLLCFDWTIILVSTTTQRNGSYQIFIISPSLRSTWNEAVRTFNHINSNRVLITCHLKLLWSNWNYMQVLSYTDKVSYYQRKNIKGIIESASRTASWNCGLWARSRLNSNYMTTWLSEVFLYLDATKVSLQVNWANLCVVRNRVSARTLTLKLDKHIECDKL
jgi:hypothetical protein